MMSQYLYQNTSNKIIRPHRIFLQVAWCWHLSQSFWTQLGSRHCLSLPFCLWLSVPAAPALPFLSLSSGWSRIGPCVQTPGTCNTVTLTSRRFFLCSLCLSGRVVCSCSRAWFCWQCSHGSSDPTGRSCSKARRRPTHSHDSSVRSPEIQ